MCKTKIVYETELNCIYDLENNLFQREQMIGKTLRMSAKFGSIENFRKRMSDQAEGLRLALNQSVAKWYTLMKQVEFIDKVISGEIKTTPSDGGFYDGDFPGAEAAR